MLDDCRACRGRRLYFEEAHSVFHYETPLRELIHQGKYYNDREFLRWAGRLMVEKAHQMTKEGAWHLVPVPISRKRLRVRGYNQTIVMSVKIGRELGLPLIGSLRKTVETASQNKLQKKERLHNLGNCFACAEAPLHVLLIDDVMTTGTTVNNCARVLLNAGCQRVRVLTLARAGE